MAKLVEYVDELVSEVGPRPAGTQQEHQASELIASRFDGLGLNVEIEEFACARNIGWVRVLYYGLCAAGAAIMIFSPGLHIVGAIAVIVGAILMVLDHLGKNPLTSLISTSLSQNVIARYEPEGLDPTSKAKKIVILAHYDSARSQVQGIPLLASHHVLLRKIVRYGILALMVLAILMLMPFPSIVITIISVVAGIVSLTALIPLLAEIVNLFMPYNQGINVNGSSQGVLFGLTEALVLGGVPLAKHDSYGRRGAQRSDTAREERPGRKQRGERGERGERGGRGGRDGRATRSERSGRGERGVRSDRNGFDEAAAIAAGAGAIGGAMGRMDGGDAAAGAGTHVGVAGAAGAPEGMSTGRLSAMGDGYDAETGRFEQEQPPAGQGADVWDERYADVPNAWGADFDGARGGNFDVDNDARNMHRDAPAQPNGDPNSTMEVTAAQASGGSTNSGMGYRILQRQPAEQQVAENDLGAQQGYPDGAHPDIEAARDAEALPQEEDIYAGKPAWFVNAKKKAEQKQNAERSTDQHPDDGEVVRSQFADMPVGANEQPGTEHAQKPAKVERSQYADIDADYLAARRAATRANMEREQATTVQADEQGEARESVQAELPAADGHGEAHDTAGAASEAAMSRPDQAPEVLVQSPQPQRQTSRQAQPQQSEPMPQPHEVQQMQPYAETNAEPNRLRDVAPLMQENDFSGLDKPAFKVVPGQNSGQVAVVVPAESDQSQADLADFGAGSPSQNAQQAATTQDRLSSTGLRSRLRSLPSLSLESTGNIPAQQATLNVAPVAKEEIFNAGDSVVSATGAFVPLGTTGVMRPVGEDLLEYSDDKQIYIEDADDSAAEQYSERGDYSAPELVQIPRSRMKSFLGSVGGRLGGKKKEELDNSPSSWLGVDERYDARKEGNEIGSWDNFHDEGNGRGADDWSPSDSDRWNGGAYGGMNYEENVGAMMAASNNLLDKEVWLVALGANESNNAGLASLFAGHEQELKSALFINLVGVGAGDLVFTISEGKFRPIQTDHRMQNLVSGAAQDLSIPIGPVDFKTFNTDATEAMRRGGRAITILGMGNNAPVNWHWSDDELSTIKEDNLIDVVNLLLETIKNS